MSLWDPVVPEGKQHPSFRQLLVHDGWLAARRAADEAFGRFPEPDGNFTEQFQTTGFDQRVWELALFAGLEEQFDKVDRVGDRPDFRCLATTDTFFVECTTAAPRQGPEGPPPPAQTPQEFWERLEAEGDISDDEMAVRLGSPLLSKLNKGYQNLPHVKGKALVFAVEAFFKEGSLWKSDSSLIRYLYGLEPVEVQPGRFELAPVQDHRHDDKVIPSGFLLSDAATPISAVIFSNAGTISKFNRMGTQAGLAAPNVIVIRQGYRHNAEVEAIEPLTFAYQVGEIQERWVDGITVMHNPRADHPLDPQMFDGVAQLFYEDGTLRTFLPDFHVYTSVTHVFQPARSDDAANSE